MLPKPSLCLNIPKTGSASTAWLFDAADWLAVRRACGLRGLSVPNRAAIETVRRIKRYGPTFGSLNARLRSHHAGYSTWPAGVRRYPKLCTLREVATWYCSYYLYYTRSMSNNMLSRAIRFLVDGDDHACDTGLRRILLRHRAAFLERFEGEEASATSIDGISVAFLVWFTGTIRTERQVKRLVGIETYPAQIGFLTLRTITLLFEDPARVLGMRADEFQEYFASGRYRQDLRCDFFLRFEALDEELGAVMTGELGYDRDLVDFLREHGERRNISPEEDRSRVMRVLAADGLLARIREDERIYERYLLPLAGSRPGAPAREAEVAGESPRESARRAPGPDGQA